MLSINTIARVIVNVVRPAAQPTSWDTGLLLVKDVSFADAKRLRTYVNSTEAAAGLIADGFADAFVGKQIAGTGHAAGQHQQVGIREVALLELQVGLDVHAVGRLHQREVRRAYGYYLYATAAQHVNGYQGLDIFEAVS